MTHPPRQVPSAALGTGRAVYPVSNDLTGGCDSQSCVGHVGQNAIESSAGVWSNNLLNDFAFWVDEEFFWNPTYTEVDRNFSRGVDAVHVVDSVAFDEFLNGDFCVPNSNTNELNSTVSPFVVGFS